ncbi:hypothetical protein EOA64_00505 [Mesorhizobium sp. M1A.F.Ca.IN.022.02.1.1]|nr:hypothetical protein EOA64_00505 [Mesorhizobium sp. M1A.F.Ca.IN.022.02.1.1]
MATRALCSIPDCGKPSINIRGWCSAHYMRWNRHGDPLFIKKPAKSPRAECSVDGCKGRVKARSFCNAHYVRFSRHGDPCGGSTGNGEVRRWLDNVAIPYRGRECLTFPYYRRPDGYGHVNISRQYMGAHVYVAERTLPPRPSPSHEVCHTCANGHGGCVSPHHLVWGTRLENVRDAIRDGTFSPPPRFTGTAHSNSKFSDELIAHALSLIEAGETITAAAKATGISVPHLSHIKQGKAREWAKK